MDGIQGALRNLRGRTDLPVFPLPNVVFFPHVTLGLHIFEPRYRQMVEEAIASDGLLAVALLQPGWERDYYGSPPVHEVACAGYIEEHQRLPDGRFNIRLRGLSRIALGSFVTTTPYRRAAFRLLDDRNEEDGPVVTSQRQRLLKTLAGLLRQIGGPGAPALDVPGDMPFVVGVNALCQSLTMEIDRRQRLLETDDVVVRCESLLEILADLWRQASLRQEDSGVVH